MKLSPLQNRMLVMQNITKAYTEGVYSDTPANRKLHRVGQRYDGRNINDLSSEVDKFNKNFKVPSWVKNDPYYSENPIKHNHFIASEFVYHLAKIMGFHPLSHDWKNEEKKPLNHHQIDLYCEEGVLSSSPFVYVDNNKVVGGDRTKVDLYDHDWNFKERIIGEKDEELEKTKGASKIIDLHLNNPRVKYQGLKREYVVELFEDLNKNGFGKKEAKEAIEKYIDQLKSSNPIVYKNMTVRESDNSIIVDLGNKQLQYSIKVFDKQKKLTKDDIWFDNNGKVDVYIQKQYGANEGGEDIPIKDKEGKKLGYLQKREASFGTNTIKYEWDWSEGSNEKSLGRYETKKEAIDAFLRERDET